nr:hypothetical protein [Tanacetum cinerariifolium]
MNLGSHKKESRTITTKIHIHTKARSGATDQRWCDSQRYRLLAGHRRLGEAARQKGYTEKMVAEANGIVHTFGSYRLGEFLDTLPTLLSDNEGLSTDDLVQWLLIQIVNSVFSNMGQNGKQLNRHILPRFCVLNAG